MTWLAKRRHSTASLRSSTEIPITRTQPAEHHCAQERPPTVANFSTAPGQTARIKICPQIKQPSRATDANADALRPPVHGEPTAPRATNARCQVRDAGRFLPRGAGGQANAARAPESDAGRSRDEPCASWCPSRSHKRRPRSRRTRCWHYQGAPVIWTVGTLFGSVRARLLDPIGANLLINQVHTKRRPTNRRPS